jgi:hypothetical protein
MNVVVPLRRAIMAAPSFLDGFAARRPMLTSMAVTAGKAGAADAFVQSYLEQRRAIDPRRTATFALFGFSYQGCFQYVIINRVRQHDMAWASVSVFGPHTQDARRSSRLRVHPCSCARSASAAPLARTILCCFRPSSVPCRPCQVLERRFPGTAWGSVMRKVLAVNLVVDPIFFFPSFYALKEWMHTRTLGTETVRVALRSYREGFREDLRNTWAVWLPGHMVTFGARAAATPILLHRPAALPLPPGLWLQLQAQPSSDCPTSRTRVCCRKLNFLPYPPWLVLLS